MRIKSTFKFYFSLHIFLILFVSCEEVIDIDLNSSPSVLIAEGAIFKDSVAYLRLTMTSDYFNNNPSSIIEDAIVTLTNDKGDLEQLQYTENGMYLGEKMLGTVGRTYSISFSAMGKNYSANTTLIAPVEILNANIEEGRDWKFGRVGLGETEYLINISFTDDPEMDNFYMLQYWNNNSKIGSMYFLTRDLFAKDSIVETSLRTFDLTKGDFQIEVFSIDEGTYKYHRQLNEISGVRMNSATPYNPISNFGREIMGYFSALSYSEIQLDYCSID